MFQKGREALHGNPHSFDGHALRPSSAKVRSCHPNHSVVVRLRSNEHIPCHGPRSPTEAALSPPHLTNAHTPARQADDVARPAVPDRRCGPGSSTSASGGLPAHCLPFAACSSGQHYDHGEVRRWSSQCRRAPVGRPRAALPPQPALGGRGAHVVVGGERPAHVRVFASSAAMAAAPLGSAKSPSCGGTDRGRPPAWRPGSRGTGRVRLGVQTPADRGWVPNRVAGRPARPPRVWRG